MPLIRCTNVFYKGDYPVTLLPPPRRLAPSLGLGTTWVRQPRSGSCHYPTAATKCNEQPSQSHRNPVGGKACSPTKGGSPRHTPNTHSTHKVPSPTSRTPPREAIPSHKQSIPNKVVMIRPSEPTWMNSNIRKHIRKRKRAYRKAKRTNLQIDWVRFKHLRNETTSLIRDSKMH